MDAQTAVAAATTSSPDKPKLLEGHWSEPEMCAQLDDITLQTLRRMPNGPPYVKVKRKRYYPIDLAKKWLAKRVKGAR